MYLCHIFLYHGPILHSFGKGSGGCFAAGIDHNAANILIQAVNRKQFSADGLLEQCGQRMLGVHTDRLDDVLVNIQAIDQRYAFENELLYAVSHGQLHKESLFFSAVQDSVYERRLSDPLRDAKNYCIIMNTLLRKAAENGGVHPIYLDRISSAFAAKIEGMHGISESAGLMREMFRAYCRLVRKHAMMQYPLIVQKTILLIDSDLSANLTLASLAAHQNVSEGYLATIFKKHTGKTVSEYIRQKRIAHAEFLLTTTKQQIQNVALYCGIMDVQYFCKIFKKLVGKTPKEYREAALTLQTSGEA